MFLSALYWDLLLLFYFVANCDGKIITVNVSMLIDMSPFVSQGRSLRESTLRRAQRRSFTPASFMEEDMADFPDELDTSFFARVS